VGEDTPMTRSVVTALLCSGLMGLATLGVVILHAIMFALTFSSVDRDGDTAAAAPYLWIGTILAASTAWAAIVLYRAPWRRLTTGRWLIVVQGCASAVVAVGMWTAYAQ
jgi:hypothetical protein